MSLLPSYASCTPTRALIIGAGPSGIAAARELDLRGIEFRIVESSSTIGGIWSRAMHPASYPGLIQNTAPDLTVFEHPVAQYALKGRHFTRGEYAEYLKDFVAACDLEKRIMFGTRATAINFHRKQHVRVDVEMATEKRFDEIDTVHVIYAGGLHHRPIIPAIRGISSFVGDVRHSSKVENLADYRKKRVLIVGAGNTAADLAVFLKTEAAVVQLSSRGSVWIVPREIGAMPIDAYCQALRHQSSNDWPARFRVACTDAGAVYFGSADGGERIDFCRSRITVSTELIRHLAAGAVEMRSRIARVDGAKILFEDGGYTECDAMIFCTGYAYCPVDSALSARSLIANVRDADHPIWYIGAPAVWGGSPRVAQYQARLAAHAIHREWSAQRLLKEASESQYFNYKRAMCTVGPGLEIVDFVDYGNFVNELCARD